MSTQRNKKLELLVWGYIRSIALIHKSLNIPLEINDIIYLYQRLRDEWSKKYSNKNLLINEIGTKLSINSAKLQTAYGQHVVQEGIFIWKLKILSNKISKHQYAKRMAGVGLDDDSSSKDSTEREDEEPEDEEVIAELKNIAQSHKRMRSAVQDLSIRLPFDDETNLEVANTMIKHINATQDDIDLLWECPYVGIIEDNEKHLKVFENSDCWDRVGCQLDAGSGDLCTYSSGDVIIVNDKYNCVWNNVGDILEIILDLDKGTLGFVVNGKDCGVAFSNIPQKSYRLALTCDISDGSEFVFL